MPVLMLLAVTAVSGTATGVYINRDALEDEKLESKIGGYPAPVVLGGLGLLGAFFGGPLIAAAGAGLAIGSVIAKFGVDDVRKGLQAYVKKQIAANPSAPPSPPADPGAGSGKRSVKSIIENMFGHPSA